MQRYKDRYIRAGHYHDAPVYPVAYDRERMTKEWYLNHIEDQYYNRLMKGGVRGKKFSFRTVLDPQIERQIIKEHLDGLRRYRLLIALFRVKVLGEDAAPALPVQPRQRFGRTSEEERQWREIVIIDYMARLLIDARAHGGFDWNAHSARGLQAYRTAIQRSIDALHDEYKLEDDVRAVEAYIAAKKHRHHNGNGSSNGNGGGALVGAGLGLAGGALLGSALAGGGGSGGGGSGLLLGAGLGLAGGAVLGSTLSKERATYDRLMKRGGADGALLTRATGETRTGFDARKAKHVARIQKLVHTGVHEGEIVQMTSSELDTALFDALISERDDHAPMRITPELYGKYWVSRTKRFEFRYADLMRLTHIDENNLPAFLHEDAATGETGTTRFTHGWISYVVYEPLDWPRDKPLATLFVTHGVPVNKAEWYPAAEMLGRVCRVVAFDLLGMGESSHPLDFYGADASGQPIAGELSWHWTFDLHAHVARRFIEYTRNRRPSWFGGADGKQCFLGANDWGAGVVQKYVDLFHADSWLYGAIISSAVTLDGYWVQEIGSFVAFANAPYGTAAERKAFALGPAVQFQGILTNQLIAMYRDAPAIHNQYSYELLQRPYVDTRSYSDPDLTPATTKYRVHNIRVLAQHAAHLLGKGALMPYSSEKNPDGLRVSKWTTPVLMPWGKFDDMMPEGQADRWVAISLAVRLHNPASKFDVEPFIMPRGEHFALADQPHFFARILLHWMMRHVDDLRVFKSVNVGFDAVARRDEKYAIPALTSILHRLSAQ